MLIARPLIEVNPALFESWLQSLPKDLVKARRPVHSCISFRSLCHLVPWLIPVGHVPRSQSFHLYCWRRLACCLTLRISVFSSECTAVLVTLQCHSITASQGHRVLRNIIVGVVVENTFLLGANTEERSNWGPHRATIYCSMFQLRLSVAKQNLDLQTKRAERQLFKEWSFTVSPCFTNPV